VGGRAAVLVKLAWVVLAVVRPHPVRVAIDGCSAAGKTTLADDLAQVLGGRTERAIVRVGSYYLDSWDNAAIRDRLLVPLGPGGSRRYCTAVMDLPARTVVDSQVLLAPDDAVLLADGVFLQRPELDPYWDLRIYVDVSFEEVLRRGIARDQQWMGSAVEAARRYRTKYIPGERRYVDEVRPRDRAQVVVGNEDLTAPSLVLRV
jgi:uridine kinase